MMVGGSKEDVTLDQGSHPHLVNAFEERPKARWLGCRWVVRATG